MSKVQAPAGLPLPPVPDPGRFPALHAAWQRAFHVPPTYWQPDEFLQHLVDPGDAAADSGSDGTVVTTRYETSGNWCGAYVKPHHGEMLGALFGEWTVPVLDLPEPDGSANYGCATWIGLDGQRLYYDSALPQVGVSQTRDAGDGADLRVSAFFQWWSAYDKSANLIFIPSGVLAVQPGDRVMGCLWLAEADPQTGASQVGVMIQNFTAGRAKSIYFRQKAPIATGHPPPAAAVREPRPTVSGATAEWITERPAILNTPIKYTLPPYSTVTYDHCVCAGVALSAVKTGLTGYQTEVTIAAARYIRMFNVRTSPSRTAFISMPSPDKTDTTRFSTLYGGFRS